MKVLKMKFGGSGEKVDAFGIRFYGDMDQKSEKLGTISEIRSSADDSSALKHKRITLWFIMERIRPYEKISDLLAMLVKILKKERYEIVFSSVDELVDTSAAEYADKPESEFPPSDRMHGYNASRGFSVTAEKNDDATKFSIEEIRTIRDLAVNFGWVVYKRPLAHIPG
ncbi:MAG: hypothetical protein A4E71_00687 [Smithella sp. PtaU1.Bin162]|nr:MAG: hypothetical protein A4E71_00687 [Smithella sp. PtaU1.Bin162]